MRSYRTILEGCLLVCAVVLASGCVAFRDNSNQSLVDEIVAMNRDVQAAAVDEGFAAATAAQHCADGLCPGLEGAMARGNEIVAEARGIAALSATASQADAVAEQGRLQAQQSYDSLEARLRDARSATAAVIGFVEETDKVNRELMELDLAVDPGAIGVELVTRGVGQLLSIAGVPFLGAVANFVLGFLPTAQERRIDQLQELRLQLGTQLVYWTSDMNQRAAGASVAIEQELAGWSVEQRNRYDEAQAALVAEDLARIGDGDAPATAAIPTQPDQLRARTADAKARAERLQRAFGNDLEEFYVEPTAAQIAAQPGTDYTLKLAAAEREAQILAAARVRDELEAIYADAYWTERYYERPLQALESLRDAPTLISRPDPENPEQTLPPQPALALLREDETKLLALHGEMTDLHTQFGCTGPL